MILSSLSGTQIIVESANNYNNINLSMGKDIDDVAFVADINPDIHLIHRMPVIEN